MEALNHLPETRRIVTGHNDSGKAIFEHIDNVKPVNPLSKSTEKAGLTAGLTLIHRTTDYPVTPQGGVDELAVENLHRSKRADIVCEIVDIPPGKSGAPAYLHRNQSLDYAVVLKGTIKLILDDKAETTLKEGDVVVQRGTLHAWVNDSTEYCRFLTVIIPSERVKVASTGEYLQATKIPGLTD